MKKLLTWKTLGFIISLLSFFLLVTSGVNKVTKQEDMVKNFEFMHLSSYMVMLGLVEMAASVMILYPKTSKYGTILVTMIMSGAIALHLSLMGGAGVIMPISVMIATWTGHCMREYLG